MQLKATDKRQIYDPFRSDVYSLGMTLLSMAALQIFSEASEGLNSWEKEGGMEGIIGGLQYSEGFKRVLRKMLIWENEIRPDFKEMEKVLRAASRKNKGEKVKRSVETMRLSLLNALFSGWKSTTVSNIAAKSSFQQSISAAVPPIQSDMETFAD